MRLPRAGEYAVRCILYLSERQVGTIVNRQEISREMDIPKPFLGKIAQQLARSGIIEIVQGSRGGYRLLKSPDQISLLDVVEGIIGEVFFNDCTREHACCSMVSNCPIHPIWEKARSQFRETLSDVSFSVMIQNKIIL